MAGFSLVQIVQLMMLRDNCTLLYARLCRIGHSDKLLQEHVTVTFKCNTGALPCFIKYTNLDLEKLFNWNLKENFDEILRWAFMGY